MIATGETTEALVTVNGGASGAKGTSIVELRNIKF
jgi:hypothetical protein